LVLALAPAGLSAQSVDEDLKELQALLNTKVTVASKTAESLNQAPGIITVVSRMEIEGFAARNVGEVLNRVVGMALLSPDVFPNNSVVVRGEEATPYNNHILVLLDGRPMRDPITGGLNGSYWNSFPLSVVERIEIIRGPGSVLYGSCAYSGVVNIISKRRDEEGTSGAVSVGVGSYGGFTQSAHAMLNKGDFNGIVGVTEYLDSGPSETFVDYNGVQGTGKFSHHSLGVVTHMEFKGFTLNAYQGNYDPFTIEGSNEGWTDGSAQNLSLDNKEQQITTFTDLGYSAEVSDKVTVGANLTYNQTVWYTGERNVVAATDAPQNQVNAEFPKATTDGHAMLYEATVRIRPVDGCNLILGGGGEKADWGGALVINGSQNSNFLYGQADYRIEKVKLIGGLQYNKLDNIKGQASPRVGVIVDITPEFGFKILDSTAFRKAYPNEMDFNVSIFKGNQALQPELINTMEAQAFYQGKVFQGALTYYHSHMSDIIGRQVFQDPTGPAPGFYLQYVNNGTWNFSGFEAEGRLTLTSRLLLTGSATWQTNENQAGVSNASLAPSMVLKAGVLYHLPSWTFGVFDIYSGAPKSVTLTSPNAALANPEPGAYNQLSAKATWKAWESGPCALKVSLEGDNLLGKYITYPDYPNRDVNSLLPLSTGRTVMGSVVLAF
jgi:outer membrane cobalamin receptor